jgi:Holliday junction DNA helicase RuvA
LIVGASSGAEPEPATNGQAGQVEPDVIQDTFAALLSVGHSESQARDLIDRALAAGKRRRRFSSVADLIEAIYRVRDEAAAGLDNEAESDTADEPG